MEIAHLNEDGTLTREWILGHSEPLNAKHVRIVRETLYAVPGKYFRAGSSFVASKNLWIWYADDGPRREHGTRLDDIKRFVKRNFPNATISIEK